MRFRQKPVEVVAIQWDGTNHVAVAEFAGAPDHWTRTEFSDGSVQLDIHPPEYASTRMKVGDWMTDEGFRISDEKITEHFDQVDES